MNPPRLFSVQFLSSKVPLMKSFPKQLIIPRKRFLPTFAGCFDGTQLAGGEGLREGIHHDEDEFNIQICPSVVGMHFHPQASTRRESEKTILPCYKNLLRHSARCCVAPQGPICFARAKMTIHFPFSHKDKYRTRYHRSQLGNSFISP